jgi:hypothetical protein
MQQSSLQRSSQQFAVLNVSAVSESAEREDRPSHERRMGKGLLMRSQRPKKVPRKKQLNRTNLAVNPSALRHVMALSGQRLLSQ